MKSAHTFTALLMIALASFAGLCQARQDPAAVRSEVTRFLRLQTISLPGEVSIQVGKQFAVEGVVFIGSIQRQGAQPLAVVFAIEANGRAQLQSGSDGIKRDVPLALPLQQRLSNQVSLSYRQRFVAGDARAVAQVVQRLIDDTLFHRG